MRGLCAFAAVFAACGLLAGSATAEYSFRGTFAGPGTGSGNGELSKPGRAAVEPSTGDLFVVDSGNNRVQVFKPSSNGTAEYLTQFGGGELLEPWGIALAEEAGSTYVYVADAGHNRIVKYDSDGEPTPTFAVDPSFTSPAAGAGPGQVGSFHAALAVDPTSGDLLVADNANKRIERFEADGTFVSSFDGTDGGSALEGPIDLATNSTGDIYVVDANGNIAEAQGTSKVLRYHGDGEFVTTLGPVGTHERPATVAVNPTDDEVVVSGDQDNVYEAGPPPFVPVLQAFDSSNHPLASPVVGTAATYDTVSGLAIGSGSADHLYAIFDVGHYSGTPYGAPQIQAFRQVVPVVPTVLSQGSAPAPGEATLTGAIDTGNGRTEYHFEWGTTAAYGNQTPTRTLAAAEEAVHVNATVTGLAAGTTYHYSLVVTNAAGPAHGSDQTFTTPSVAPEACSNAAVREAQYSTALPECRAFELVSPVDKNGNEVAGFYTVQAAPGGERIVYGSTGAFPGSAGSPIIASYLGVRGHSDWTTKALSPLQLNPGEVLGAAARDFSTDLDSGVSFSKLALAPGAVAGDGNIYLQDDLTGGLRYVGGSSDPAFFSAATNTGPSIVRGASEDFGVVALESAQKLTANAPAGTVVYEIANGTLRVASVLPDGTAVGGVVGNENADQDSYAVSADGKRVVFANGNELYQRIEGKETVELSKSELPEPSPSSARFAAATPDGKTVFFTAWTRLTASGAPEPTEGHAPIRLFRYAAGKLEELAVSEANFNAQINVLAVTPDGDTAYFSIENQRAPTSELRRPRVYRWHLGEGVQEIFALEDLGQFDRTPEAWSTSPNGRYSSFTALSRLTPDAQAGPAGAACKVGVSNGDTLEGHCYEIYVYDAATDRLSCASCSPTGVAPTGQSTLGWQFRNGPEPPTFSQHTARGISNDGTVYFDTPTRLVPADADGKRDVYEWNGGISSLLTPNTPANAVYGDASVDGSTVYVLTSSRLVAADQDGSIDLYAVRRGGGFMAQSQESRSPSCEGEQCQGVPGTPPLASSAGSSGIAGSGEAKDRNGGTGFKVPPRAKVKGSKGFVSISVPGPGTVTLSGSGLKSVKHRFARAGKANLAVALTPDASKRLKATGKVIVNVNADYRPQSGGNRKQSITLTFVVGKGR